MKIKEFIKKNKITILFILMLVGITLLMMIFRAEYDTDYFWHIKAGKYMVTHHTILTKDVFSWIVYGKSWMAHEWLFEVLIYLLSLIAPKSHVLIYCFITTLGILLVLYLTNKKNYEKNIPFTLIWLTFFIIIFGDGIITARPHMLDYIMLPLVIYLCYDLKKNENSKKIYFLPLISVIWVNLHGGSSNLIYIVPIIFLITGLFNFSFGKIEEKRLSKKQILTYLIVILIATGALLINPRGIKILYYPYLNMNSTYMLKTINEWQPSNLNSMTHYPYFVLLLFGVIIILISKKKLSLTDGLLFLFFMYLGLKSIRFWFYMYLVLNYIVFNYVNEREYDKDTYLILSLVVIGLFALGIGYRDDVKYNDKVSLDNNTIDCLRRLKPQRLFNMYNYGGYLVYKDFKVFMDGRADLYYNYNYRDYFAISNLDGDYKNIINKYNFDYLIVTSTYSINNYLGYNPDSYELIYSSGEVRIYKNLNYREEG